MSTAQSLRDTFSCCGCCSLLARVFLVHSEMLFHAVFFLYLEIIMNEKKCWYKFFQQVCFFSFVLALPLLLWFLFFLLGPSSSPWHGGEYPLSFICMAGECLSLCHDIITMIRFISVNNYGVWLTVTTRDDDTSNKKKMSEKAFSRSLFVLCRQLSAAAPPFFFIAFLFSSAAQFVVEIEWCLWTGSSKRSKKCHWKWNADPFDVCNI